MAEPDASPATLLVLWTQPDDAEAFDADYRDTHMPLARQIPGLLELRIWSLRAPGHHRLAELRFACLDDLRAGMRSAAGRAVGADAERLTRIYGARAASHVAVLDEQLPGQGR